MEDNINKENLNDSKASCLASLVIFTFLIGLGIGMYFLAESTADNIVAESLQKARDKVVASKEKVTDWAENLFSGNNSSKNDMILDFEESNSQILMYHHVKDHLEGDNSTEINLSVEVDEFEEQIKYLSENNYNSINISQLFENNDNNIAITFDDGYRDNITNAYPILQKYGFVGTVYVITDFVENDGYLTWEDIKKLDHAGWEIGSHTLTHPNLTNASEANIKMQVEESKLAIEEQINNSVISFCYPAGHYNDQVINILEEVGYKNAVSIESGNFHNIEDIFHLDRIRVSGTLDIEGFISKIN